MFGRSAAPELRRLFLTAPENDAAPGSAESPTGPDGLSGPGRTRGTGRARSRPVLRVGVGALGAFVCTRRRRHGNLGTGIRSRNRCAFRALGLISWTGSVRLAPRAEVF